MTGDMLVVEDDPVLRNTFTRVLRSLGLTVIAVGSVTEAKNAFQNGIFSVVMSDMMLPDGTGKDFHSWVAENFPGHQHRFFFCSGSMSEDLRAYILLNDCKLFVKPLDISALIEAIGEKCDAQQTDRRPAHADGVPS
jgi:two-component system response regulator PilR (NtrC family)